MSLYRALRHLVSLAAAALLLWSCSHGPAAPPFTLTDDAGQAWSLSDQRGSAVMLTFGFTHCADTCPATLAKLTHLAERQPSQNVEIAFITVDPQRDSVAAMRRFVDRFRSGSARVVGLTGSAEQIDAVERRYHVWAQRIPGNHRGGGYDVSHSAVVFFIDPSGVMRSLHDDDDSDAVLSRALREAAT
jgi:protein SCO1/2